MGVWTVGVEKTGVLTSIEGGEGFAGVVSCGLEAGVGVDSWCACSGAAVAFSSGA